MEFLEYLQRNQWAQNAIASAALFLSILFLRLFALRRLSQAEIRSSDLRRRWSAQIRNAGWLLLLFGLVLIWATELRTFALSVVAALAAIVLATKELILCVMGSLYKTTARAFVIGERIEIGSFRGIVVDQTLVSTTLYEADPGQTVQPHAGRAVVVPNSMFLSSPVVNESFTGGYVLHTFRLPAKLDDWKQAEENLLRAAREVCEPYLDQSRRQVAEQASRKHLDPPPTEPSVLVAIPEPGRVDLVLRLPAPIDRRNAIEQAVVRRFLALQTS